LVCPALPRAVHSFPTRRSSDLRRLPRFRPALVIGFAAAVITALVQSFLVPIDCDVSWLITVNEKMLAGQRLYVDIIEVNPPASIDRKSTRLNSSHVSISYAVFC